MMIYSCYHCYIFYGFTITYMLAIWYFCLFFFRFLFALGWFYFMQAISYHNQGKEGEIYIIIPWWLECSTTKPRKYQFFFIFTIYFLCEHNFISKFHSNYTFQRVHLLTHKFGPPKVALLRCFIMLILYHVINLFIWLYVTLSHYGILLMWCLSILIGTPTSMLASRCFIGSTLANKRVKTSHGFIIISLLDTIVLIIFQGVLEHYLWI